MEHRNSLLKHAIRQALRPSVTPPALALCLLAAVPLQATASPEWNCKAAADGSGWNCSEVNAGGTTYQRPQHAKPDQSTVTGAATATTASAAPATRRTATSARTPAPVATRSAAEIDWQPATDLANDARDSLPTGCCGTYVEPLRTDAEASANPDKTPLRASADTTELQQETTAVMTGNVKLIHGYRQLETDKVVIHQDTDQAELTGNIRLREPGLLVTGSSAEMNIATGAATVHDASYLMHESRLRGDATTAAHQADNVLVIDNGTYTRCEPDSDTWLLRGSEIAIDKNAGQGTGKHVRLYAKGVPIFYTPYIRFPLGDERQSGFLMPSFGFSSDNGADITVPYYFNLAPNYDMTLAPRYISERGTMLETELRHLSEQFATEASFAYLGNDDGGKIDDADRAKLALDGTALTDADLQPYKDEHRWLADIRQEGGVGTRWSTLIDYTRASDDDFFRDLDVASLGANSATHLKQLGQAAYRFDHWDVRVAAEEYQTLMLNIDTPYKQLPRINMNGGYQYGDWIVKLDNEYVSFDHREEYFRDNINDPRIIGQRVFTDYSLSWDKRWQWGFIKPSAITKSINYQLEDEHLLASASDNASIVVPQGSLDAGLFFEREGSLLGRRYIQTLEPRLFYFYSDFESHDELFNLTNRNRDVSFDTTELTFSYGSLFRDYRFSGHDRIGDDHRLTTGITTRFIEASSGIERLSASLGQIRYFDDRAIDLVYTAAEALEQLDNTANKSEIAAQVSARISDHWQFSTDVAWDESNSNRITRGSSSLRYMDESYRILNLSYRFLRPTGRPDTADLDNDGDITEILTNNIDQADISFLWPVTQDWSAIGRVYHDFVFSRELETLAGFEYNSCCYRLRLVARRWIDNDLANVVADTDLEYDKGIFLEFVFKGLGAAGTKVSNNLSDSIYGYAQREENLQ